MLTLRGKIKQVCRQRWRGENKRKHNKLLDARRISYLLIKVVCFRARVNAAVSRFLNKFKSAARSLETKDAPRFPQSCVKINGVLKIETRPTNQWTRGETATLLSRRRLNFTLSLAVSPASSQPLGVFVSLNSVLIDETSFILHFALFH